MPRRSNNVLAFQEVDWRLLGNIYRWSSVQRWFLPWGVDTWELRDLTITVLLFLFLTLTQPIVIDHPLFLIKVLLAAPNFGQSDKIRCFFWDGLTIDRWWHIVIFFLTNAFKFVDSFFVYSAISGIIIALRFAIVVVNIDANLPTLVQKLIWKGKGLSQGRLHLAHVMHACVVIIKQILAYAP